MNQLNPEKNNIIIARFNPASLPKFQWAQEKRVIYASIVFFKKNNGPGYEPTPGQSSSTLELNSSPGSFFYIVILRFL
jgi:hypothetical protein